LGLQEVELQPHAARRVAVQKIEVFVGLAIARRREHPVQGFGGCPIVLGRIWRFAGEWPMSFIGMGGFRHPARAPLSTNVLHVSRSECWPAGGGSAQAVVDRMQSANR